MCKSSVKASAQPVNGKRKGVSGASNSDMVNVNPELCYFVYTQVLRQRSELLPKCNKKLLFAVNPLKSNLKGTNSEKWTNGG